VAIGRRGASIPVSEARRHILGYGVGLDLTLRDVQSVAKQRGQPWAVAKGFDTSAPMSEIVPAGAIDDPGALEIELYVNGERRQHGHTRDMITSVEAAIAYVSTIFTLDRGDLIFTGTPEGVGPAEPGDRLEGRLVGHAAVRVTVASDTAQRPGP